MLYLPYQIKVVTSRAVLVNQIVEELPDQVRDILHFEFVQKMVDHFLFVLEQQVDPVILRVFGDHFDNRITEKHFFEYATQRLIGDYPQQSLVFGHQHILFADSDELLPDYRHQLAR